MDRIGVLLADDHTLFRAGLHKLLDEVEDIEVVGEAGDGDEAVRLAHALQPDVILMDISMPGGGGVTATRRIKEQLPEVCVLVVTVYANEEYVRQLLQVGSSGYVLKEISPDDLVDAIHRVSRGEMYLGSSISKTVLREYTRWAQERGGVGEAAPLSHREQQVLEMVRQGVGNKEIADRLYISPRTVENHKQHIVQKLGLSSAKELVPSR